MLYVNFHRKQTITTQMYIYVQQPVRHHGTVELWYYDKLCIHRAQHTHQESLDPDQSTENTRFYFVQTNTETRSRNFPIELAFLRQMRWCSSHTK
jgi:hypothetical protein